MRTKHSSGLWEVAYRGENSVPHPFDSGPSDAAVVAYGHGVAVMCGYLRGREEQEANARLIATAPKLLEALKLIHAVMIQRNMTDDEREVADKAWIAIREAEGEL